ncbi:MAG: hypothetical protein V1934_08165 [Methanobacteriota archaeon]
MKVERAGLAETFWMTNFFLAGRSGAARQEKGCLASVEKLEKWEKVGQSAIAESQHRPFNKRAN